MHCRSSNIRFCNFTLHVPKNIQQMYLLFTFFPRRLKCQIGCKTIVIFRRQKLVCQIDKCNSLIWLVSLSVFLIITICVTLHTFKMFTPTCSFFIGGLYLRVRAFFLKTFRSYHVNCNFILGCMCRITVIFGTLKPTWNTRNQLGPLWCSEDQSLISPWSFLLLFQYLLP